MEMTPESAPGSSSTKRARAKRVHAEPKVTVKASAEAPAAKKPRTPRKTVVTQTTVEPSGEEVGSMIATAAYYLAAARNFSPGHELDDWLEAERSIRAKLYG